MGTQVRSRQGAGMKVICAGFPKTGTKSMAMALRELGYTVHDYPEHVAIGLETYLAFFQGRVGPEAFLALFSSVDAVVDQPACNLWSIFIKLFPEAKVILMERDSEEVWASSYAGMFAYYREKARPWYHWALPWLSPTHWKLQQFTEQCVMFSTASTDAVNRTDPCLSMWRTQYLQHNAA